MTTTTTTVPIERLRTELKGRVITPQDADYDALRAVMNGAVDRRPAIIARVADAEDVARAIAFAREAGLEIAARSGGHSSVVHGVAEGGLVIDLRDLKGLEIDPQARTAWAGSGLTAVEYSTAAAEHGLATSFGDTGSVGLGGLVTGGGIGYLVRKHGLSIDHLLAAEVVTADGRIREVDAEAYPDLFWAIRGGGGNFGVVTRFKLRLEPVDGIVGGMLFLPATPETVEGFIAAAEAAPEDLSTIANVMPMPPMPFVPEEEHGKLVIFGLLAYSGPKERADEVLAPFRVLATPIADLLKPMPYPEIYPPEPESEEGAEKPTAYARIMFLDRVDRDVAQTIVDRLNASDASMRVVQLRVLGGAMARVPAGATAFAHRSSRIMAAVAAFYAGPDDLAVRQAEVDGLVDELRQTDTGAYVNFVGDEGEAGVRAAYPGKTYDRLAEIKRRYDPGNVFHMNQNVPPASA